MTALLDNIEFLEGTERNRANLLMLKSMVRKNLSHAFLFYGNSYDSLNRLALIFAASINCPQNGCGKCRICRNTLKGVDANLMVVEPDGNFLLKEDVLAIKNFVSVSANRDRKKIVVIKESETMNLAFANKFLKTLEEPPDEQCIFILLAAAAESLLPTVVSRCMEFEWSFVRQDEGDKLRERGILKEALDSKIKKILGGDAGQALNAGSEVVKMLDDMASDMEKGFKEELEVIKQDGADPADAERQAKFISKRHKRKLSRFNKLGMNSVFDIIVAWLEDIAAVKAGAGREALNQSSSWSYIDSAIPVIDMEKITGVLESIELNRSFIGRSINRELALDRIFLGFRDALKGEK